MAERIIIGISGASGVIYGIRLLEVLKQTPHIETHLVMSGVARATILEETSYSLRDVESLAGVVHSSGNVGASIASGSFAALGMIIAPCSIKTLSAIANSYTDDLMSRAADVQLKEGRPVLLMVRETPLHTGHLKLMLQASENGAVIMPPVPAFYGRPRSIEDLVNITVGRALARIGIDNDLFREWQGMSRLPKAADDGRPVDE